MEVAEENGENDREAIFKEVSRRKMSELNSDIYLPI